jgi:hypothetical protein
MFFVPRRRPCPVSRASRRRHAVWLVALALLGLGLGKEMTGDDLLAQPEGAQLTYVAGWLDGYLQALDGVHDRAQLAQWRTCLQGHSMAEMRVRVVYYYSRHDAVRKLRLQLTMLDALLEACERPPRFTR